MNADMALYYATMNLADFLALKDEELDEDIERELYSILDKLTDMFSIDIPSTAEANDCGYCETWQEIVQALKELFKSGNRIKVK